MLAPGGAADDRSSRWPAGSTCSAHIPLEVLDRGSTLGVSSPGRLLVPAAPAPSRFVNEEFGVNTTHDVSSWRASRRSNVPLRRASSA